MTSVSHCLFLCLLERVELSDNEFGGEAAVALAKALQIQKNLKVLNLSYGGLGKTAYIILCSFCASPISQLFVLAVFTWLLYHSPCVAFLLTCLVLHATRQTS